MPENEAFLRMILDHPEDDGPRLVYADWFEEQGDTARAELIRVQIEMTQTADRYGQRWHKLRSRQDTLLKTHKKTWTLPFKGKAPFVRLERGFVEEITIHARRLFKTADELFALAPIRAVKFVSLMAVGKEVSITDLAIQPVLGRLQALDLDGSELTDDDLRVLLASPHLSKLQSLNLSRNRLSPAGIRDLLASPALPALRELILTGFSFGANSLGDEGLRVLAGSPGLARLKSLTFAMNDLVPIRESAVLELVRSLYSANLEELNLTDCSSISGVTLAAFAESDRWSKLEKLNLNGSMVDDAGLTALIKSPKFTRLRWLGLGRKSNFLSQLRDTGARITDVGVKAMTGASHVPLRVLDLSNHDVTEAGAEAFMQAEHLNKLGHLNLKGTLINDWKRLRKHFGTGVCELGKRSGPFGLAIGGPALA